jgi:hypothetical protein
MLQVFGVNGASFNGWTGDLTGPSKLASLVLNGNKTVTASFTGNAVDRSNLVKNGDFANGTSDWNLAINNNAKATEAVTNGVHTVTIQTPGSEAWHIQFTQTGISLKQNENYVLSFTASAQSNTAIIANIGMPASPYTSYSKEQTIDLTSASKTYTFNFTMTEASTADARMEFNSGKASGAWMIDDISLTVALKLPVAQPAPRINVSGELPGISPDSRVSIAWYDHSGRLLRSTSGDYGILKNAPLPRHCASCIMVVRTDKKQLIKKIISIGK